MDFPSLGRRLLTGRPGKQIICPGEFLKTRPTIAHRRLQSSSLALLVGLFSAFLLAPAPRVSAEPIDPQANSLQSAVDSFVAYLKTETNAAMRRALSKDAAALSQTWREA